MILNDNPKVRDWLGEHPDNVIVVHCKVTLMMVANKEFDYKQNIARIAKAAVHKLSSYLENQVQMSDLSVLTVLSDLSVLSVLCVLVVLSVLITMMTMMTVTTMITLTTIMIMINLSGRSFS